MGSRAAVAGFSSLEIFTMVVVALAIGLMAGAIAGRSFERDRLADAVAMVAADVERVREAAVRGGVPLSLRPVSDRAYVAADVRRTLPGEVRFDTASSARTLSFTVWGTLSGEAEAGDAERLVLVAPDGRRSEISVESSGELTLPRGSE